MKKVAALFTTGSYYLFNAMTALAADTSDVDVTVHKGDQGLDPTTKPSDILTNILEIVFVVAILLVLFFLILGAFKWITSGGEKDAVGKARGTITNALIGLAILALAFVIANVAGQIVGINFQHLVLPRLDKTH